MAWRQLRELAKDSMHLWRNRSQTTPAAMATKRAEAEARLAEAQRQLAEANAFKEKATATALKSATADIKILEQALADERKSTMKALELDFEMKEMALPRRFDGAQEALADAAVGGAGVLSTGWRQATATDAVDSSSSSSSSAAASSSSSPSSSSPGGT